MQLLFAQTRGDAEWAWACACAYAIRWLGKQSRIADSKELPPRDSLLTLCSGRCVWTGVPAEEALRLGEASGVTTPALRRYLAAYSPHLFSISLFEVCLPIPSVTP